MLLLRSKDGKEDCTFCNPGKNVLYMIMFYIIIYDYI